MTTRTPVFTWEAWLTIIMASVSWFVFGDFDRTMLIAIFTYLVASR